MPPLAVGALIVASIQHLKDASSTETELRGTGDLYLRQTLQAFGVLRPKYNSADCAIGFIERVRSGKVLSRTFEWEDRANHRTPDDEDTVLSTGSEPNASAIAQTEQCSPTSPYIPDSIARLQNDVRYHPSDIFGSSFVGEEDFDLPYFRSSTLDADSELLLSATFDASNIDWTNRHWHDVRSTGT
jgi:hypothetical protein